MKVLFVVSVFVLALTGNAFSYYSILERAKTAHYRNGNQKIVEKETEETKRKSAEKSNKTDENAARDAKTAKKYEAVICRYFERWEKKNFDKTTPVSFRKYVDVKAISSVANALSPEVRIKFEGLMVGKVLAATPSPSPNSLENLETIQSKYKASRFSLTDKINNHSGIFRLEDVLSPDTKDYVDAYVIGINVKDREPDTGENIGDRVFWYIGDTTVKGKKYPTFTSDPKIAKKYAESRASKSAL